jgi:hypothetical protein
MSCRVLLVGTDVSEKSIAYIFRVKTINELNVGNQYLVFKHSLST